MSKKNEILHEFNDVHIWLLSLGIKDISLLDSVTKDAIQKTSEYFNISYEKVRTLVAEITFQYTDDEIPVVIFFHEYLRKIRDLHR
jgi:hypothetical protein